MPTSRLPPSPLPLTRMALSQNQWRQGTYPPFVPCPRRPSRAQAAIAPLLAALPIDPFAILATAFRSDSLLLLQMLFAVQHRAGFHPLRRTLSSLRVHLPAYTGHSLSCKQTGVRPPAIASSPSPSTRTSSPSSSP
eukprot:1571769-Pleurochrysis_carterae.AAC.1